MPPSTRSAWPFTNEPSSESRKAVAAAMSAAVPIRPSGGISQPDVSRRESFRPPTNVTMPGVVSPGQTALTRIPCGPASIASIWASQISARLDTE